MTRFLALLAALSATAWAQFNSLATPYDGSSVYFTTTLGLKSAYESPWGKVFAADERGVRLVESRSRRTAMAVSGNCFFGPLYTFSGVELSADGKTLAARGRRWTTGECHGAGGATLLRSPAGSRDVNGFLRLSANGRWAIVDTTPTVFSGVTGQIVDLSTGNTTAFQFSYPGGLSFPAGRAIADDGTAVFRTTFATCLVRPGGTPQAITVEYPIAIGATGTRLLNLTANELHVTDLRTQQDWFVGTATTTAAALSDDGTRAVFVADQLWVADVDGGTTRQVSNEADGITSAVLSGNGKIAYAVTGSGRLVRIAVDTGATTEIVGRTPAAGATGGSVDAGMFTTITGVGLAGGTYTAGAPLPLTLGGVSVSVDGRLVPLSRVTPTEIDALIPYDMASSTPRTVVVNVAEANTPFEAPQSTLHVGTGPRTGALYRQDWTPVSDLTVHTGEIIHVFAVGLGAVMPEVVPGFAAPSSEPLSRLTSPMSCSNATVLYAGLQPGAIARIYQVDLRIGSTTGYQQFGCTTGGMTFAFLTLNVVP